MVAVAVVVVVVVVKVVTLSSLGAREVDVEAPVSMRELRLLVVHGITECSRRTHMKNKLPKILN